MSTLDLPGLSDIRPADLTNFLANSGWSRLGTPKNDVVYYQCDGDRLAARLGGADTGSKHLRVQVLLDTTFADYHRRVAEVIDTLAALEQRQPQDLISELLSPPSDVLRMRIVSDDQRSGLINLDQSIYMREALRELLIATAHAVIKPMAVYPRMGYVDALKLVSQCREGQTARGSYVANILVPVAPEIKNSDMFGPGVIADPFSRRVTVKLMEALNVAADGVALTENAESGVSANFLDALGQLEPPGETSFIELGVRFSVARRAPALQRTLVRLNQESFSSFREAARVLRVSNPETQIELIGYIVKAEREESGDAHPGTITLVTQVNKSEKPRKIRAELPIDQYRRALDAHKKEEAVRVAGLLTQQGRLWILRQAVLVETGEDLFNSQL